MNPKLPKNLSDLPEYDDLAYEVLPTGETIIHRKAPELEFCKIDKDDPIAFSDVNGAWIVEYHLKGGPYKRRMYF